MIARMWRGWTRLEDADAYAEGLRKRIRDQVSMPGKIGSVLLSQRKGERCEFVTISFWESREAIRVLAGERIEQAVFFPLDDQYLVERETTVTHFEVVGSEGVGLPSAC
jgi:heme-degrading monooxygenase HmoA